MKSYLTSLIIMLSMVFGWSGGTVELSALVQEQPSSRWMEEIDLIDQAIEKLSDLKNKELARAARAQDLGDRLQFQSPNLIDARRAWQDAEASRAIAARYQQEIDQLQLRREEILRERGQGAVGIND